MAIIVGAMLGAFLVTKEPLDKIIKNDMNSNIKYGTVTTLSFSEETGDLSESLTLKTDTQKSNYEYDTVMAAIKTMEVAEKYQKVKYVKIDVSTSNPNIPKTAHFESRTKKGINWATQSPKTDIIDYSKNVFDVVTWYVNPNEQIL